MLPHTSMSGTIMSRTQAHHTYRYTRVSWHYIPNWRGQASHPVDTASVTGHKSRKRLSTPNKPKTPVYQCQPRQRSQPIRQMSGNTAHTNTPSYSYVSPTIVNFVANRCQSKTAILRCTETFNLDFSLYLLKYIDSNYEKGKRSTHA